MMKSRWYKGAYNSHGSSETEKAISDWRHLWYVIYLRGEVDSYTRYTMRCDFNITINL